MVQDNHKIVFDNQMRDPLPALGHIYRGVSKGKARRKLAKRVEPFEVKFVKPETVLITNNLHVFPMTNLIIAIRFVLTL